MIENKITNINYNIENKILLHSPDKIMINAICKIIPIEDCIRFLFRNKNFILDTEFAGKIISNKVYDETLLYLIAMKNIDQECLEMVWFKNISKSKMDFYLHCCETILENQKSVPESILKNIAQTLDFKSRNRELKNLKKIIKILNIKLPN